MAYIELNNVQPGIRSLFLYRPDTAQPLCDLAEALLRSEGSLSRAERELIATYVSYANECEYCQSSHGAIATHYFGGDETIVRQVKEDIGTAAVSKKIRALLRIAGKVQQGGKFVNAADVEEARQQNATDREIHDTVLIASAFCMYNRYVDGLKTLCPSDSDGYRERAKMIAAGGYGSLVPRLNPTVSAQEPAVRGGAAGSKRCS